MLFSRHPEARETARGTVGSAHPARLLAELVNARRGLSITAPDLPGHYVSLLLEVRPDAAQVLLDELMPASGHSLVREGMTLRVESTLGGMPLGFDCQILAVDEDSRGGFYRVTLPESVRHRQRRQHFRVHASAKRLNAALVFLEGERLTGQVADLSADGLCLRLACEPSVLALSTGDELGCTLLQPGNPELLETRIEVRRVIEHPAGRGVVIGARITEATPVVKRHISKLIAQLERDLARKRPRGQPSVG